jgi:predicted nucleic-acid-binding Zn-ribbon protein
MKTLKFLIFAVLALSMAVACSGDKLSGQGTEMEAPLQDGESTLTGTQWKLAALVDVQTREFIELEPKRCNKCYTIEFVSDTKAIGKSVMNELIFVVTPSKITMSAMTKIGDSDNNDAGLFYDALQTIDAYEYNESELKIYYDNKNKYLSYKPLSQ